MFEKRRKIVTTGPQHMPSTPQKVALLTPPGVFFAMTGKSHKVALSPTIMPSMPALAVKAPTMVFRNPLKCSHIATPYKMTAWQDFLMQAGLAPQQPNLAEELRNSFHAFMPPLSQTFTPHNHPSINQYKEAFDHTIHKKLAMVHRAALMRNRTLSNISTIPNTQARMARYINII